MCLTLLICLWSILLPDSFGTAAGNSMRFLTTNFAWLYCLAMTLFVAFCLWIGLFSKYRNIPLGPDGAKPEYSKSAWFSMLFCAGMGVGLVFWGAAEPMNYFAAPIGGLQSGTGEAMRFVFARSFLHWGIHPWANYSVLALALAYMQFRKGQPGLINNDAGHGQRPFHAANLIHCGGLPLHFHHAGSYAALVKALKEEKL